MVVLDGVLYLPMERKTTPTWDRVLDFEDCQLADIFIAVTLLLEQRHESKYE